MELTRPVSVAGMRLPVQLLIATAGSVALVFLLSVLVAKLGAFAAMAAVTAVLMGCALCLLPRAAAFVAVFLLYTNLVVVFAGSPLYQVVGASSVFLLALPVADQLLIRGESARFDRVFGLMVVFLVVLLVSAFVAEDINLAIKEIVQYVTEGVVIYLLVINLVRSTPDLHRVMAAGVLSCAVLSTMTIYQVVTHDYKTQFGGLAQRLDVSHPLPKVGSEPIAAEDAPVPIAAEDEEDGIALIDRASGPIGDPNRYAQLLLVVLPWSLYFSRHGRTPLQRLAAAATAALIMTAVALTYSRGAFITVALLVLCLLVWRYIRPGRLALGALVLVAIVAATAPGVLARVGSIGGVGLLGKQDAKVAPDGAIKGRATEMLAALAVYLDHPFLGVGPGQYVPFYSEKYQLIDELSFRHLPRPREAHNLYFSIGAETGSAGLLVFFLIVGTLFVGLRWARRFWLPRSRRRADLAVALSLSLVAYLGTGVFLHLSFERYLWFLVAIASAAIHILRQDQLRQSAEEASWR
ncbi:MAG TPA: O-antigen ligase family protein [Vicinamibacterales bacterium]|nr:O-antigen ligase family protein [Vicinamibacterales bacterium]